MRVRDRKALDVFYSPEASLSYPCCFLSLTQRVVLGFHLSAPLHEGYQLFQLPDCSIGHLDLHSLGS